MEYALGKRFSSGIVIFLIKLKSWHECTCSCKVFHRGWSKIDVLKKHSFFFIELLISTVQNTVTWDP